MAALIDFKSIHAAIKAKMSTAKLKYHTAASWFNYKLGSFPLAAHSNGYTIMPGPGNKSEEYEAYDWFETPWTIEFCLDANHDIYLDNLCEAYAAVKSLESIDNDNVVSIECMGWDTQNIKNNLILTFDLMITINETQTGEQNG